MLTVSRNIYKILYYKPNIRIIPSAFCGAKLYETEIKPFDGHEKCYTRLFNSSAKLNTLLPYKNLFVHIQVKRCYSKKKGSKRNIEVEEESDDEEEEGYQETVDQGDFDDNVVKKSVPSLRLDSVLKAGLGLAKKKIEKEFYSGKIRVNGAAVLKKAFSVSIRDEIDLIKGFSPDNHKFLIVDRVIVKSIGKVGGTGNYPINMEILKALTIENYEQPWNPSNIGEIED